MSVVLVLLYSAAMLFAGYQFRKHSEAEPGRDVHAVRVTMLRKI